MLPASDILEPVYFDATLTTENTESAEIDWKGFPSVFSVASVVKISGAACVEVVFSRGVYLPELDLWLDSLRRRDMGVISHAHSDHTARHHRAVLTPGTRLLLSDYLPDRAGHVTLEFHEPLETERYTMTLYPAGHCLGSAQALVVSKATGERVLYTGDFKARASCINEPLEPAPCDTLVMEATYGRPEYTFPPEEQVLATACRTLEGWLSKGERPVVLGWRLGKSQEILHHLLSQGFEVAVEESAHRIAQRYQQAGVRFPGAFVPFDAHSPWREGQVLIAPPGAKTRNLLGKTKGLRFMELTGWALNGRRPWGRRGDADLPFSDHADFNELVEYVARVKPKQVYTVNGFPELAAHLRSLGYPAVHLNAKGQPDDAGTQMRMM